MFRKTVSRVICCAFAFFGLYLITLISTDIRQTKTEQLSPQKYQNSGIRRLTTGTNLLPKLGTESFSIIKAADSGAREWKTGTFSLKKFSTESASHEKLAKSSDWNGKTEKVLVTESYSHKKIVNLGTRHWNTETSLLQKFANSAHLVPQFYLNGSVLDKENSNPFVLLNDSHIMYCPIHKNANSLLLSVFGFLIHAAEKYDAKDYQLNKTLKLAEFISKIIGKWSNRFEGLLDNSTWRKLAIVRHPVDRLISGYLHIW